MTARPLIISVTPLSEVWASAVSDMDFKRAVQKSLLHIAAILHENHNMLEKVMALYDQLIADVAKQTNLSQALMDALNANTKTMKDALAATPSTADTAALQQAIQQIEQNNANMAAAVLANTPAQAPSSADTIVKNDGPTAEQANNTTGLVPPTQGASTAGVTGPGPDQAPAATAVDAPKAS